MSRYRRFGWVLALIYGAACASTVATAVASSNNVTGLKGSMEGFLELYENVDDSELPTSFMEVASGTPRLVEAAHPLAQQERMPRGAGMFKPRKKFTFRNVSLYLADNHLDVRDANGIILGRFTMNQDDEYTMSLLSTLNQRHTAKCDVKWVPTVKDSDKSSGEIKFECKSKLPAVGYTGQIPIAVEVTGLTKDRVQRIYLNTDGYYFRRDFENLDQLRHSILLALGIDLDHKIRIAKVNGHRYPDDDATYQAIMKHVERGGDTVKLTVEPMIRVKANVQEPYSSTAENFNKEVGNISINDYMKMLKDTKRLMQMANDNLGEDANGFTLVGINDLHEGSKGFNGRRPYKMPVEIDEKLTFMPDVTVRFHYLDTDVGTMSFPVHTLVSTVINKGRDLVKKNRGGKDKNAYRLYAYALPGCPLEEGDVYNMMKLRKNLTIAQLPFSETCFNRRTHIINFFYLNNKPANYVFDVELTNPDGSRTKPHRLTVKYVNDADLSTLKDAIVREFEKEGYMVAPEDLTFVNVIRSDGGSLSDNTPISKLADIPKEQMLGHVSHLNLSAHPHLMGYFTESGGKHDTFDINLPTTRPSAADIRDAFEKELHLRNLLKPEETLHTSLRFHPLDGKHKIRMNLFVNPDDEGHFPTGTKLRGMAAEADSRYEIPISFTNDDGKVHRFTVHIPYGATEQQMEDLIADEIERRKYGDRPHEMYIRMKGRDDDGLGGLWDGEFNKDMEFNVEPARRIDIGGVIDDFPTKISIKIHPHESRDELERAIRRNLMRDPVLEPRFRDNPNHINDVSTLIINEGGVPYSDDDFKSHDIYDNIRKVRIGVSDHPLTLSWRDPMSGNEHKFCFSRAGDVCRGVPVEILARMNIQQLSEVLRGAIRSDNRELHESIESLPRKNSNFTSTMKLDSVILVGGQRVATPDIKLSDPVAMVEHLYGTKLSHVASLVFSLMTHQEQQKEQQKLNGNQQRIRLSLNKRGDEPESHVVTTDDLGPSELRHVINKYFRGVDDGSQMDGMTINGENYTGQPLSYFLNKMNDKSIPLKVEFGVSNDAKHGSVPLMNVKIQPKYNETLRSYFERASDEPGDFGLSPLHAYGVECLNEKGERIHVEGILDLPLSALGMCKELRVHPREQGRSQSPGRVFAVNPDEKMELHTSITLDENKDSTSNLNRQLRNFLMDLPEDELDHVTIMIDDKPMKCSVSSLREAYFVRNLTLDMLLSMCNMDSRKAQPSVFKIHLEPGSEKSKGGDSRRSPVSNDGTPLCHFTLHKGPHDVGVSSTVPITLGSLKSPLKDFNGKLLAMFGDTISHITDVRLSVVRNGEISPCSRNGKMKNLSDFQKVPLQVIFQMCGIPIGIPEANTYYHFRLTIPFGEDMTYSSGAGMGGSVPVEMMYKDDDEYSSIHYDEDLRAPLHDFLVNQPDLDRNHMDRYLLRVKGENPGSESVERTFKLNHLPSDMSLSSIFPHTPMSNIVFNIEDTADPYNSAGGWKTGMSYPANDYRNNFDAIKRQMILNLKAMHGNKLSKLNGYNVTVSINGQKHQCNIKSLPDLERMTFEEFTRSCVNIENVQNNPLIDFNVGYESGRGDPEINLNCICGDYDNVQQLHLKPGDAIPQAVIDKLTKKYTATGLPNVQWGIMINGMPGNCHLDDITTPFFLSDLLESCGVDGIHSRHFDITLHDFAVDRDYAALLADGDKGKGKEEGVKGGVNVNVQGTSGAGFSPLMSPTTHILHPSSEFSNVHPNVFVNMPQQYNGPNINMDNRKSLNDYVHEIVMDEDRSDPGVPINVQINTNGHRYNMNDIPMDDLNYPSGYLNGNVSINVRPDPSGSLPGTIRTFHLPATDKPLSSYLTLLRNRIPDMENKRLTLVGPKSMLDEDRIPLNLLNKPMNELRKLGFVVSLVNSPKDMNPSGAVTVNILSRDGFNSSANISDLQEPLRDVFAKIGANNVDLHSLAGARFKVVIDGIEKTCDLPSLDRLLTSVSMQDILSSCGIRDLNHSHSFTLYFDSLLGGESGDHRSPIKFEVDLDNNVDSSKNVDFSSDVDLSGGALDFLKSKPNSHIFFDMEGKGFREFVEVDTEKFRKLLKSHPNVVDLLLRMGIPQEHLGGVDCLKIILSTLSHVLQGHQQYSVNNGTSDEGFNLDDPISKHKSIVDVATVLKEHPEQDVTVSVSLSNGNTKEFVVPNREFLHALNGGLSFKTVALWGLSQSEADQITNIHFNTAPFGGLPDELPEEVLPKESASSSPVKKGPPKAMNEKNSEGVASEGVPKQSGSEGRRRSLNAGTITPDTLLRDVGVISKAIQEHDRNVKFVVGLHGGHKLEILVKGSMLKGDTENGSKITDLLSKFLKSEDMSDIASISVQLVSESRRFFVPLKNHDPVVMPIMAADYPQDCEIQEFKNPWNPPDAVYRRLTLEKAIEGYRDHYKVQGMDVKAAYLLRKEAGNNISAELLFDESHPATKDVLGSNIGKSIESGSTLFLRFKSSGVMGLFDYVSSAFAVFVEVNYYVIGAGVTYIIVKLVEFQLFKSQTSYDELFAKRVKPAYTLVLDLDDTILHSVRTPGNNTTSSVALTMGKRVLNFVVYKRPHLDTFLMEMRKIYEIVLYSTSKQSYVDACLNDACVNHLFDRKLYRNDCSVGSDGSYIKDLSKVSSDMSKVVLLHNPLHEGFQFLPNVVPIDNWFGGQSDTALLDVMPFLEALIHVDDVRQILELRCNDPRAYGSALNFRLQDYVDSPAVTPRDVMPTDISREPDNWDTIGARLTSRVKQIFDTVGSETELPNQLRLGEVAEGVFNN
ncbi:CTD nuclear envelope phosphatase 1 [Babesia sp. Xinjiang]|uniref:CTD nuclear envelope phosphatase 1 n=1 Tax=Babesia sp. Xinjiang TaxID=462227 RepID=UPI000A243835|nr:CTD nuclear envelope phosphatase 1 [Babesia sp. Xinjiang]ORM40648.1 CTD nuclear envelope phosphatase 1 [Babesia sp. Xinjiang]